MNSGLVRRLVLPTMAAATVFAVQPGTASGPASDPFTLKPIAPGVYAAIDGPEGRSGSNAGFVIGDDGVLVIDSFFNPDATRALVSEIHRLTPKPIRYVVNTHYHADHVGGDAVLRAAGAMIIAHRNVRGWVRTENLHLFGEHISPKTAAMIKALPLPDLTTEHNMTIWLGNQRVLIEPALGHTGGDLMVTVPDAKTIFCGDILWRRMSPNIIDGDVASWAKTVAALQQAPTGSDTVFVPGHGDVATLKDVGEFEHYLSDLLELVTRKRAGGLYGKALVEAALPEFAKQHGDWTAFTHFAPLELGFMDDELAGKKRRPLPVTD
ncbi:MBL fold metallo-hydrolase [Sphingomonas sp. UYP23]